MEQNGIKKETPREKKVIYVDIGHNVKNDNGAFPEGGLNENECATQIGTTLMEILNNWGYDARLAFTETSKKRVERISNRNLALNESLRLRTDEANRNEADLYVSIHLNANNENTPEDEKERGTSIYIRSEDEKSLANSILYHICNTHYDLGPDTFTDGTVRLGKTFKNNGVLDGRELYVLKNTDCPAILIETLYADHLNDINVYKDLAPYVNHEDTLLEEGVRYNCENVFSYNFFGFCIARGIDDYFNNGENIDKLTKNSENGYIDLNYVCITDIPYGEQKEVTIRNSGYKESLYGRRLCSLMRYIKDSNEYGVTKMFLPYPNFNSVQSGYADIYHHYADVLINYQNLAIAGKLVTTPDPNAEGDRIVSGFEEGQGVFGVDIKAIEFKLRYKCNLYRSDGSAYTTLKAGDTIGIYLEYETSGVSPQLRVKYEDYNGASGPVRCAATKPNWIKINYAINSKGEKDTLYNIFTGSDYAWLETNLDSCMDINDFTLVLNV